MRRVTSPPSIVCWLSLEQVGLALGMPRGAVRRLITDGPLRGAPFGRGRYKVRSDDLAAYEAAGEAAHMAELRAFLRGEGWPAEAAR